MIEYFSDDVQKIVKTFGCDIPTSIHHSVMSIVNEHTLKVRCQKGFQFGGLNLTNNNRTKKKIRFIKCRNSVIVNNVLPKCVSTGKPLYRNQQVENHKDGKSLRGSERSHPKTVKERQINHRRHKHKKDGKYTKGFKLVSKNTCILYQLAVFS